MNEGMKNIIQIATLEDNVGYAIKELREILKVYHYDNQVQHMSKDVATSLENLLGRLLKWVRIKMISILFLVGICVIGILAYLGMKGTGAIWVELKQ